MSKFIMLSQKFSHKLLIIEFQRVAVTGSIGQDFLLWIFFRRKKLIGIDVNITRIIFIKSTNKENIASNKRPLGIKYLT